MKLSIVYLTNRIQPMVEWFCDSLANQITVPCPKNDLQVIFIDSRLWYDNQVERKKYFSDSVKGRFDFIHIPPKDTVWQGPKRLTTQDYFAASNARNTGAIYATGDYILFVDDLSVLSPQWIANALHAANNGYLVCGAYKKVKTLLVSDGHIKFYEEFPQGIDSRWSRGSDHGIVPWTGSALYGCSFGCPLSNYLEVEGFDESLDSQGGEDYDFGIRIERTGLKCFYNRNMLTLESEELHSQLPIMKRVIKKTGDKPDASIISYKRVVNTYCTKPYITQYPIKEQRHRLANNIPLFFNSEPQTHWYDNMPLCEM